MFDVLLKSALFRINLEIAARNVRLLPTGHGVYFILHRDSGKIYIGSGAAVRGFRERCKTHVNPLRAGRHRNPQLQNYFRKHGIAAFDFGILEFTSRERARAREMWYLEKYKPWVGGFNVTRVAGEHWTREVSESAKAKLAAKNAKPFRLEQQGQIFEGVNLTAFARARGLHQGALTQVLLGKMRQYKGWTLPGAALPSWELLSPAGELHKIRYFQIAAFARCQGLDNMMVRKILRGRVKIHRGWRLPATGATEKEIQASAQQTRADATRKNGALGTAATFKEFEMEKDGKIFTGRNASEFCRLHGLAPSAVSLLRYGKIKNSGGFRWAGVTQPRPTKKPARS